MTFQKILKAFFAFNIFMFTTITLPVAAAEITSPFGWRVNPISGEEEFHPGIDIAYEYGTPVGAMLPGRVVYAAEYGGYGNCVILAHEGGYNTLYAHLDSIMAVYDAHVEAGDVIGYVGSTGFSTGPHLHLELWDNGEYEDPLYLWR